MLSVRIDTDNGYYEIDPKTMVKHGLYHEEMVVERRGVMDFDKIHAHEGSYFMGKKHGVFQSTIYGVIDGEKSQVSRLAEEFEHGKLLSVGCFDSENRPTFLRVNRGTTHTETLTYKEGVLIGFEEKF
jgi:hypothetical protein